MKLDVKTMYDWPLSARLVVIVIIALFVIAAGYWWDLSSLRADIAEGEKKEEELKLQLESSVSKTKKLDRDLAHYEQLVTSLAEWKKKIIVHSQVPTVLNDILKLGASNRLYFTLFNPEQETVAGVYRQLPIKIIVVGTYHQIGAFYSQIANMPWLIVIGNFVISNEAKEEVLGAKLAEQAKAQNLLTAELSLAIYHYPDPNELPIIAPNAAGAQPGTTPGAATTPGTTPPATTPSAPTPAPTAPDPAATPTPAASEAANAPKV